MFAKDSGILQGTLELLVQIQRTIQKPAASASRPVPGQGPRRGLQNLGVVGEPEIVVRRQVDDRLVIVGRVRFGLAVDSMNAMNQVSASCSLPCSLKMSPSDSRNVARMAATSSWSSAAMADSFCFSISAPRARSRVKRSKR